MTDSKNESENDLENGVDKGADVRVNENSESQDAEKEVSSQDAPAEDNNDRLDPIDEAVDQIEQEENVSEKGAEPEEEAEVEKEQLAEEIPTKTAETSGQQSAPVVIKSRSGIAWFALLLALVACGLSGYIVWHQFTVGQAQTSELGESKQRLDSIGSTLSQQEQQLSLLEQQLSGTVQLLEQSEASSGEQVETVRAELKVAQQLLDSHARRLLSLTATTTDDWRIAEVDYLLRLANQRILISRDAVTAKNLLAEADKIILELGDPRLFDLRRAIAEDKAALDVVGEVDTDGLFLTLAALANSVDELPIISAPVFERVETTTQAQQDEVSEVEQAWYAPVASVFAKGWEEVQGWLIINKNDAEIKPLLPPDQQYYLRANLKLLINQAQLALLESRPEPYATSLTTAANWIDRHFPMEQAPNQRFTESLKNLSVVNIAPEYPDLSESLLTIKAFIRSQQAQVESVDAVNAGTKEGEQ